LIQAVKNVANAGPNATTTAHSRRQRQGRRSVAVSAGFTTYSIDLFNDSDLQVCGPSARIDRFQQLEQAAAKAPPSPFVYLGGLENHPGVIHRISQTRQLLGIGAEALAQARDPFQWSAALTSAGIHALAVSPHPPRDSSPWLKKPLRSIAGKGIVPASVATQSQPQAYFQQFQQGESQSGLFLANGDRCLLLGVCKQLLGPDWGGESRYTYCGSIGPLSLDSKRHTQWTAIGECLTGAFGLMGLFGVDAIADNQGVWSVEINPRYTASAELLERSLGVSLVGLHVAAAGQQALPDRVQHNGGIYGKCIIRSRAGGTILPEYLANIHLLNANQPYPRVADIPPIGAAIAPGGPIVTYFTRNNPS